jgi:hypothetical protein
MHAERGGHGKATVLIPRTDPVKELMENRGLVRYIRMPND